MAVIIIWIGWNLIRGNKEQEKKIIHEDDRARAKDVEYTEVKDRRADGGVDSCARP